MKAFSLVGWSYLVFGMATCGYFCAAAIGGWSDPLDAAVPFNSPSGGRTTIFGGGSTGYRRTYSGGSSHSSTYGRSWGGSWGGGK